MANSAWADSVEHESDFWDRFLGAEEFAEIREYRRKKILGRSHVLNHILGPHHQPDDPDRVLRILDVGSGPLCTLGVTDPEGGVLIDRVDALADAYNSLLTKHGLHDLPRVLKVKGEELTATFGRDCFDWVNCANALDHCEDPAQAFREMIQVCRPGGLVCIVSNENEGERENYSGLHQWNLLANDDGFWLWNKTTRINLLDSLSPDDQFSWKYTGQGEKEWKVFIVEIWKAVGKPARPGVFVKQQDAKEQMLEGRIENFNGSVVHGWTRVENKVELYLNDIRSDISVRYIPSKDPQYQDFHIDLNMNPRTAPTPLTNPLIFPGSP